MQSVLLAEPTSSPALAWTFGSQHDRHRRAGGRQLFLVGLERAVFDRARADDRQVQHGDRIVQHANEFPAVGHEAFSAFSVVGKTAAGKDPGFRRRLLRLDVANPVPGVGALDLALFVLPPHFDGDFIAAWPRWSCRPCSTTDVRAWRRRGSGPTESAGRPTFGPPGGVRRRSPAPTHKPLLWW